MRFKELETREVFSNKYGTTAYIDSYCHYAGTEQISIYVKTGYGASEQTINVVISEHDLEEWLNEFQVNSVTDKNRNKVKLKFYSPNGTEVKKENRLSEITIYKHIEPMENENTNTESVEVKSERNDYVKMRNIIFDTMIGVKDGTIDIEKAKVIATLSQTLINSVKTENDFLKITGEKNIKTMIH